MCYAGLDDLEDDTNIVRCGAANKTTQRASTSLTHHTTYVTSCKHFRIFGSNAFLTGSGRARQAEASKEESAW